MNAVNIDPADLHSQVNAVLAAIGNTQDQLLPALHAIQDLIGFIPPETVASIATGFNLSRAEVHGVITFYHHFRSKAPARHVIQLCRAEACQSMGADALLAHAERTLGCTLHANTLDGDFTLEPAYCLGQCATSPAMMVDDAVYARVSVARFDSIIAKAREAA